MDTVIQDLKFVFRSVARRPGFTAAVILTLGLGLGANTAIFSVVNGVLLNPLPFEAADRLVTPNVMSTRGFYISTSIQPPAPHASTRGPYCARSSPNPRASL